MMLKSVVAGVLASLSLMGSAYAATCPAASSITAIYSAPGPNGTQLHVTVNPEADFKFTSARLKDKDSSASVVICRYEGAGDLGASVGWRTGAPVQGTVANWEGDDCVAKDNDPAKCSFK
ncbi:hypothetical protein PS880_03247 [Pseudomonas fluorescens]|uniref:Lipoprotein n=2 Tax=Pseudomonas fluorescens TaxID=294 RepID=A0A5E7LCX2_PSEFL|nr:hypothetical protein PS880_03247 [Pseudomonas fluorescens]